MCQNSCWACKVVHAPEAYKLVVKAQALADRSLPQQVSRTDEFEDRNIGASAQYSHMKRNTGMRHSWSPEISQADMAFAWSKCLAPVYAFNLIGIRAALKYKVCGEWCGAMCNTSGYYTLACR